MRSEVPLKDYATGKVTCANKQTPHVAAIPANDRYRRLAAEIDATKVGPPEVEVWGLLSVRTEGPGRGTRVVCEERALFT
jgi:hypothetical protein